MYLLDILAGTLIIFRKVFHFIIFYSCYVQCYLFLSTLVNQFNWQRLPQKREKFKILSFSLLTLLSSESSGIKFTDCIVLEDKIITGSEKWNELLKSMKQEALEANMMTVSTYLEFSMKSGIGRSKCELTCFNLYFHCFPCRRRW